MGTCPLVNLIKWNTGSPINNRANQKVNRQRFILEVRNSDSTVYSGTNKLFARKTAVNCREHGSPAGWRWARLPTGEKRWKHLPIISYMHIHTCINLSTRLDCMFMCLWWFALMHTDKHARKGRTKQNLGQCQSDIPSTWNCTWKHMLSEPHQVISYWISNVQSCHKSMNRFRCSNLKPWSSESRYPSSFNHRP